MTTQNRPLSPHITVYKMYQLTSFLSTFHRGTGVFLMMGVFPLVIWLGAAAYGGSVYTTVVWLIDNPLGWLCLLGWTFCLFFHLCNGIRHLFWDIGLGFEMTNLYLSGYAVGLAACGLTMIAWLAGLWHGEAYKFFGF